MNGTKGYGTGGSVVASETLTAKNAHSGVHLVLDRSAVTGVALFQSVNWRFATAGA
jgi:hypothetical protein